MKWRADFREAEQIERWQIEVRLEVHWLLVADQPYSVRAGTRRSEMQNRVNTGARCHFTQGSLSTWKLVWASRKSSWFQKQSGSISSSKRHDVIEGLRLPIIKGKARPVRKETKFKQQLWRIEGAKGQGGHSGMEVEIWSSSMIFLSFPRVAM